MDGAVTARGAMRCAGWRALAMAQVATAGAQGHAAMPAMRTLHAQVSRPAHSRVAGTDCQSSALCDPDFACMPFMPPAPLHMRAVGLLWTTGTGEPVMTQTVVLSIFVTPTCR